MQQRGILSHHANVLAQGILGHAADILAINENAAAVEVVKAQQQIDQGRFTRARAPDQADFFTGFNMNIQVAEHFAARFAIVARVMKGGVLQADFSLWHL